jgi:hypothetical protein
VYTSVNPLLDAAPKSVASHDIIVAMVETDPVVLYILPDAIKNKILLLAEEGVIEADKVPETVTKEVDDVVLVVESVAVTACNNLPLAGNPVTVALVRSIVAPRRNGYWYRHLHLMVKCSS